VLERRARQQPDDIVTTSGKVRRSACVERYRGLDVTA
jgi:hypothetical protein